jgi:hypothetical protein
MDSPEVLDRQAVKRALLTMTGSIGGILCAAAGGFGIAVLRTRTYGTIWYALAAILCGGVAGCLCFRLARHEIGGRAQTKKH